MTDLRVKIGTKACTVGTIEKNLLRWSGHIVRMNDSILPEGAVEETRRLRITQRNTTGYTGGLSELARFNRTYRDGTQP